HTAECIHGEKISEGAISHLTPFLNHFMIIKDIDSRINIFDIKTLSTLGQLRNFEDVALVSSYSDKIIIALNDGSILFYDFLTAEEIGRINNKKSSPLSNLAPINLMTEDDRLYAIFKEKIKIWTLPLLR
ncbi:MAG: hypothetical protein ACM3JI_04050, partial [Anaerolineae bacterium]